MIDRNPPTRPASYDKKVGLVLQGGGALGSYQAGVYEALASSEYLPDWVAGISIGAINACGDRWQCTGAPRAALATFLGGNHLPDWAVAVRARRTTGDFATAGERANGADVRPTWLFHARALPDWFSSDKCVSYYKTSALKGTLERLVDFDRINDARDIRFSVGAVNVRTGHFAYFDSEMITIRPEHVMASGALPPAFPPVEID